MEILSKKYPGRICICGGCGALLGNIKEADIYGNNLLYCPICRYCNNLEYDRQYDGLVKENKN